MLRINQKPFFNMAPAVCSSRSHNECMKVVLNKSISALCHLAGMCLYIIHQTHINTDHKENFQSTQILSDKI